jgi:hypothetical protein
MDLDPKLPGSCSYFKKIYLFLFCLAVDVTSTRMKRDEHGELDCCRLDPSLGSAVLPPCMDTKPYKEEQMTLKMF